MGADALDWHSSSQLTWDKSHVSTSLLLLQHSAHRNWHLVARALLLVRVSLRSDHWMLLLLLVLLLWLCNLHLLVDMDSVFWLLIDWLAFRNFWSLWPRHIGCTFTGW